RSEVIAVGLAYRLRPWISMGIGMLVLPQVHTVNTVLTPNAAEPADSVLNYNIENEFDQAITAGVLVRPLDWLRIGVTFQDELYLDLNGHNEVQLGGTDTEEPVEQIIDAVQHYTPPRLSGAIALEGADGWLITAEGTWLGWSRYLDHHGQQHSELEDVINWRLGFEAPLLDDSFVRAGLGWSPSPVPDQTGRSNFVDNDRVTFAIGAGRDLTLWDQDFTVDLSVQLQTLLARETTKRVAPDGRYPVCGEGVTALCDEVADREVDTPVLAARDTRGLQTGNPGFPGFSSGGYLISAGVDIKWRF
ncbi:MAG: outer membrane protein transport protein, partial [Myxococcales bacterium]|nr:outer membrane protein transport protein [Myxococcales bacterium]